jgi:nucleoid-associated protein YgaU
LRRATGAFFAAISLALLTPPAAFAATHQVRRGDTLTSIALDTFGDSSLWPAIYLANRDQIKDPSRVYPGQLLKIPEIPPEDRDALRREGDALLSRSPESGVPTAR